MWTLLIENCHTSDLRTLASSTATTNLQLRILLEMTSRNWDNRISYAALGKKLGVDDELIRLRIKKITESGLLKGWHLIINPHVIGTELASVLLDCGDYRSKEEIIAQLKLVDRVIFIFDFFDDALRVAFYYEDEHELQRKANLIRLICSSKTTFIILKHTSPPFSMRGLRRTDWEILKELRKDPKMNSYVIARELGLSTRTVSRRLNLLLQNNTFHVLPVSNLKKSKGLAHYLFILYSNREKKMQADKILPLMIPQIVYFDPNLQDYTALCLLCEDVAESEELIQRVKEMDGVKSVTYRILKDIIPTLDWFDHEIEKKLA
jgi:DNA-binding Lrp family transcriptional regulator